MTSRLWLSKHKLVLASRSRARQTMLVRAGIPIEVVHPAVDERGLQREAGSDTSPEKIALMLASAKALAVANTMAGRLVLGSDQILDLDGNICNKVADRVSARKRLQMLSGRMHKLHSAYSFARDGVVVRSGVVSARLSIRTLSDDFIENYLDERGPEVLDSVAVYEIEGLGVQMFDSIDGDWFTIQGLPLNVVMTFLRDEGCLLR
jgi:septum formation protein